MSNQCGCPGGTRDSGSSALAGSTSSTSSPRCRQNQPTAFPRKKAPPRLRSGVARRGNFLGRATASGVVGTRRIRVHRGWVVALGLQARQPPWHRPPGSLWTSAPSAASSNCWPASAQSRCRGLPFQRPITGPRRFALTGAAANAKAHCHFPADWQGGVRSANALQGSGGLVEPGLGRTISKLEIEENKALSGSLRSAADCAPESPLDPVAGSAHWIHGGPGALVGGPRRSDLLTVAAVRAIRAAEGASPIRWGGQGGDGMAAANRTGALADAAARTLPFCSRWWPPMRRVVLA